MHRPGPARRHAPVLRRQRDHRLDGRVARVRARRLGPDHGGHRAGRHARRLHLRQRGQPGLGPQPDRRPVEPVRLQPGPVHLLRGRVAGQRDERAVHYAPTLAGAAAHGRPGRLGPVPRLRPDRDAWPPGGPTAMPSASAPSELASTASGKIFLGIAVQAAAGSTLAAGGRRRSRG